MGQHHDLGRSCSVWQVKTVLEKMLFVACSQCEFSERYNGVSRGLHKVLRNKDFHGHF